MCQGPIYYRIVRSPTDAGYERRGAIEQNTKGYYLD